MCVWGSRNHQTDWQEACHMPPGLRETRGEAGERVATCIGTYTREGCPWARENGVHAACQCNRRGVLTYRRGGVHVVHTKPRYMGVQVAHIGGLLTRVIFWCGAPWS